MKPDPKRYWSHVTVGGPDECWGWIGAHHQSGYGRMGYREHGVQTQVSGHRYSWELHNGPIPDGLHVCHRCDNPPCTNPAHLFLGTRSDNMTDAYLKGRLVPPALPGESNPSAILTATQAAEIQRRYAESGGRKRGTTYAVLAADYGVSSGCISHVLNDTWRRGEEFGP